MGCDIHAIIEEEVEPGKFLGLWSSEFRYDFNRERTPYPRILDRNYDFFARIAGVRGNGGIALGTPNDRSELTAHIAQRWRGDAHSWTYMPLEDFLWQFAIMHGDSKTTTNMAGDVLMNKSKFDTVQKHFFKYLWEENIHNKRIVLFFDN